MKVVHETAICSITGGTKISATAISFAFHHPSGIGPSAQTGMLETTGSLSCIPDTGTHNLTHKGANILNLCSFSVLVRQPLNSRSSFSSYSNNGSIISRGKGPVFSGHTNRDFSYPDILSCPLCISRIRHKFRLRYQHHGHTILLNATVQRSSNTNVASMTNHISNLTIFPGRFADAVPLRTLYQDVPVIHLDRNSNSRPTTCVSYSGRANVGRLVSRLISIRNIRSVRFINDLSGCSSHRQFTTVQTGLGVGKLQIPSLPLSSDISNARR